MKLNLIKKIRLLSVCCAILFIAACSTTSNNKEYSGYLFTYFTGNGPGEEAVRYALSKDGYNYYALNNNEPIIDSKKISSSGGVRDPHILRGEDGKTFYMVITDLYVTEQGWNNYAMILMKSTDLINWTSSIINIPETYPEEFGDVKRVWAPQTIYDKETKQYMIYWSMLGDKGPDIIYYAYANEDFTALATTPKQLYFSPSNAACIDGDIIYKDGKYHLFFKNEDASKKGIMQAVSDNLTSGYEELEGFMNVTKKPVEGSSIFKLIDSDEYILMYDMYSSGKYQFTKSKDLKSFAVVDDKISMNFHPRHGTVIPITKEEELSLLNKWGNIGKSAFVSYNSKDIKKNNVVVDDKNNTIYLPVNLDTDLKSLNPEFQLTPGITASPEGAQDFFNGPVTYSFSMGEKTKSYKVSAQQDNNPVLNGFYADPEIIYSHKTNKYYLYPTSDGFTGWSGTYFKTFSSPDLVNWTDEGVIVDLKKDVSWANRNAWAPTAIEKKINGEYKYFYYFTAAQKIGVAVSDNPTGPFVDSGKPLIAERPKGIKGGQEIDPDVFTDPVSGKSYLYWGNGYMACAELNKDMVSIKKNTIKIMTPDRTFREGAEIFYRKGKYYFLWSEDDTRSPNYRVRYATSNSPTGKLNIPENNIVIEKKPEMGIYGTGHNSVIQTPDTDVWHIVYHRFNRPNGITMGSAAGFNREVCIDKLEFNSDGSIITVKPTITGIKPVN
ncbi:beta-xylosidase [Polaribacter reichenbachii]|uniref:Beta-xylosidase n=1 Tax=Polaribacter reichenbachii TaxID=996801 RepID=A0A1B8U673_9FLAO|nr:family 43 glycosylhydrolase [Polaribacter reichenbachii]APZ45924.1 beta-xylosidase [Polaribacter reichenbachii]AUC19786.1 beta-xylosidase [Polaribacter reichenbachii]OBY67361.1 beta-xylosidase [Polaribacter reichenbachii]